MNATKEARIDAQEFARAQMYYGEGAGIRRKLINNTVDAKVARDPVYGRAFDKELRKQDMADHASKARKERTRRDTNKTVSKNIRGIATGNYQSVNTGLLVIVAAATIAHKTGYDQVLLAKSKRIIRKIRKKIIEGLSE